MKQSLSVVIAAKNEEKIIKQCFDAVVWADEIIIVDNGSTDKTIKICKKYTSKICSYKKKVLIPLLQNVGIQKATKDWILILDADVIVPKETAEEIKTAIQKPEYDGYYILHKTFIMGGFMKSPFWTFPILKLFRRGSANFEGKGAHESITFRGKAGQIRNPLLHYSHPSLEVELKKINLYSSQDAEIMYQQKKGGLLKRKIKKVTIYHLLIQPCIYFLYLFFWRKGYKDGMRGFIVDVMMAFYVFLEAAKVWEKEINGSKKE